MNTIEAEPLPSPPKVPVKLFALAAGILIMNLFAPQTLVGMMGSSFGLSTAQSGTMAMMTLLGYSGGLFFLVPLADMIENRRLVMRMLACAALAAIGVIFAPNIPVLFTCLFVLGAGSAAIQVLMPAAAAMASAEMRGRVLGDIMSGLMTGILLSRPISSGLASFGGWTGYFYASFVATILLGTLLYFKLPSRKPEVSASYGKLIRSLWELFKSEPILRRRSISAGIGLAAFNFFWTTVVFVLGKPPLRAVGAANGKNPISIVAPCHRVIGTNKKLTGFAGGLEAKMHLLNVEHNTDYKGEDKSQLILLS